MHPYPLKTVLKGRQRKECLLSKIAPMKPKHLLTSQTSYMYMYTENKQVELNTSYEFD